MKKKIKNIKDFQMGIFSLFVVGSVGWMSFIIWSGLDGNLPKVLTAPALIWASLVLVNRFTR